MNVQVDLSELTKLADDIAADIVAVDGGVEEAVGRSTSKLRGWAVADAPVATGELRSRITMDTSGLARRVYAPVRQAFYQEYGTSIMPPHPFLMVHADRAQNDLEQEIGRAKWGPFGA